MPYVDALVVVGVSVMAALIIEAVAWAVVYRTARYEGMKAVIKRTSRKVEGRQKRSKGGQLRDKKKDRYETSLKEATSHMTQAKVQLGVVTSVTLLVVFGYLSSLFDGKVVAKLPFKPFSFLQKVSHRSLPGDDATDCAMAFVYMLCSMSIRPNLQKLLGFAPPRGAGGPGLFALPEQKTK